MNPTDPTIGAAPAGATPPPAGITQGKEKEGVAPKVKQQASAAAAAASASGIGIGAGAAAVPAAAASSSAIASSSQPAPGLASPLLPQSTKQKNQALLKELGGQVLGKGRTATAQEALAKNKEYPFVVYQHPDLGGQQSVMFRNQQNARYDLNDLQPFAKQIMSYARTSGVPDSAPWLKEFAKKAEPQTTRGNIEGLRKAHEGGQKAKEGAAKDKAAAVVKLSAGESVHKAANDTYLKSLGGQVLGRGRTATATTALESHKDFPFVILQHERDTGGEKSIMFRGKFFFYPLVDTNSKTYEQQVQEFAAVIAKELASTDKGNLSTEQITKQVIDPGEWKNINSKKADTILSATPKTYVFHPGDKTPLVCSVSVKMGERTFVQHHNLVVLADGRFKNIDTSATYANKTEFLNSLKIAGLKPYAATAKLTTTAEEDEKANVASKEKENAAHPAAAVAAAAAASAAAPTASAGVLAAPLAAAPAAAAVAAPPAALAAAAAAAPPAAPNPAQVALQQSKDRILNENPDFRERVDGWAQNGASLQNQVDALELCESARSTVARFAKILDMPGREPPLPENIDDILNGRNIASYDRPQFVFNYVHESLDYSDGAKMIDRLFGREMS